MNAKTEAARIMELSGLDIYEMTSGQGLPGGFSFTIPGVALGSHNVTVTREPGEWVLSYSDDPECGYIWIGRHDDLAMAYLDLIANRLGYK